MRPPHNPFESSFVMETIQWLNNTFEMIYRELHIDEIVDRLNHEMIDVYSSVFNHTFTETLDKKIQTYKLFLESMDGKIHNSINEICVDGQPDNFWDDPVHYMLCSYTLERWVALLEGKYLVPCLNFATNSIYGVDHFMNKFNEKTVFSSNQYLF